MVTVLDCVSADGTVLPPWIIMKGKRPSYAWAKDSRLDKAWICASPNGWTDNELGEAWIERLFDPETRGKLRCVPYAYSFTPASEFCVGMTRSGGRSSSTTTGPISRRTLSRHAWRDGYSSLGFPPRPLASPNRLMSPASNRTK